MCYCAINNWLNWTLDFDYVGRPKRLFVFVNPFGGKKSAVKIFDEQVKPLFEDAQIQLTIQGDFIFQLNHDFHCCCYLSFCWFSLFCSETAHQLHAKEVARSLDITKHDGIVCISGDGILVEVSFIVILIIIMFMTLFKLTNFDFNWDYFCFLYH
jgi:sphingosine kinase